MGLQYTKLITWFDNYETFGVLDTLGGFNKALPTLNDLPTIQIKSNPTYFKPFVKQLFDFDNYIPFTPIFSPDETTEILYTYHSAFPISSELKGLPVGIVKHNKNNKFYTFGFHLWAMEIEPAKELINYMMNRKSNHFPTFTTPNKIDLVQNYPNPFNATTTISFALPDNLSVSLEIYNVLGQKIKTLLNSQQLQAGNHHIKWNGNNEQNNTVASGIYFYRLQIHNEIHTKKMVLLK